MDRVNPIRPVLKLFVAYFFISAVSAQNVDEVAATKFLEELDPIYLKEANAQMKARWQYITDVNDENSAVQIEANIKFLDFQKQVWNNVTKFNWTGFTNSEVKREFQYLNIIGPAALPLEDAERYTQLSNEMETIYSKATVCMQNDPNKCVLLDPDLTEIMATSTDYKELEYIWTEWHKEAGKPIRDKYIEFVGLNNKAAELNGYDDMGSLWNEYYLYEGYSEDQFKEAIDKLWNTVKPLYVELYTYVRRILSTTIYAGQVQRYGRLPAHVLGNMWAQTWGNIAKHVLPYPDAPAVDATQAMVAQGVTYGKMFGWADIFFADLGLDHMTQTFWDESMYVRPDDGRDVVCHASAEEFFFGPGEDTNVREDWRIKMCTTITQEDFVTVHHGQSTGC